jgi:hypothetical protein
MPNYFFFIFVVRAEHLICTTLIKKEKNIKIQKRNVLFCNGEYTFISWLLHSFATFYYVNTGREDCSVKICMIHLGNFNVIFSKIRIYLQVCVCIYV